MSSVGVTGHQMIPPEALAFVEKGIAGVLDNSAKPIIGVSSLAAGADQLFADALCDVGGQLHVVVPCRGYEETFSEQADLDRFLGFLMRAEIVETLDHPRPSEQAFLEAGRRVVDLSDVLIAVWDGKQAKGKGGTADIVGYARECDREVIVVWPTGVTR